MIKVPVSGMFSKTVLLIKWPVIIYAYICYSTYKEEA